jgi:hypothetical protein
MLSDEWHRFVRWPDAFVLPDGDKKCGLGASERLRRTSME